MGGGGGVYSKNVSGDNQNEKGTNTNQKQKLGWVGNLVNTVRV